MLPIGKYQPHQHKEITQDIRDFFAADHERIADGLFAKSKDGRPTSVLSEDVFALCLRGAWYRLIGQEAPHDEDPKEQGFAEFLGFDDVEDIAAFNNRNAHAGRYQNIINLLDERLAA